jgi:hypothetical protein
MYYKNPIFSKLTYKFNDILVKISAGFLSFFVFGIQGFDIEHTGEGQYPVTLFKTPGS